MKTPEISLKKIKEARERIKGMVNKTPCIYSLPLSRNTKKEIFLKLENLQITLLSKGEKKR